MAKALESDAGDEELAVMSIAGTRIVLPVESACKIFTMLIHAEELDSDWVLGASKGTPVVRPMKDSYVTITSLDKETYAVGRLNYAAKQTIGGE